MHAAWRVHCVKYNSQNHYQEIFKICSRQYQHGLISWTMLRNGINVILIYSRMLATRPTYSSIICLNSWTTDCHWRGSYDWNASGIFSFHARWLEAGNPTDVWWAQNKGKGERDICELPNTPTFRKALENMSQPLLALF